MNIEKVLTEILYMIVIAAVPIISRYIILWLDSIKFKTDNEILNCYVEKIKDIVNQAVIYVNQTYTDELKKQNIFNEKEQDEAFKLAKDTVLSMLDESVMKLLDKNFTDTDVYLDILIESTVNQNKKG